MSTEPSRVAPPAERATPPAGRRYLVYLAGPEVFLPEAVRIGEMKKEICARHGFEGGFPLDDAPGEDAVRRLGRALAIFEVCVRMMERCDLVIANMTPFRGVSMDVGTAVEIGFMHARGKPVFGYTNRTAGYEARVEEMFGDTGLIVEPYRFADNLMCEGPIRMSGGSVVRQDVPEARLMTDLAAFEECVEQAAGVMLGPQPAGATPP